MSRRTSILMLLLLLLLTASLAIAACGGDDGTTAPSAESEEPGVSPASPSATTSPAGSPTAAGTTTVLVYFLRGEKLGTAERRVPGTLAVARAAMTALCGGPTGPEKAAGLGTTVPEGTKLLGISIAGGTATVDLSGEYASGGGSLSMMARVSQVVYTLTQFKSIKAVTFKIDGKPVEALGGEGIILDTPQRRADWQDFEPPVFVERPGVGAVLPASFVVSGRATVFEATVSIAVLDENKDKLVETFATATMGAPERGSFRKTVRVDGYTGAAWLDVYEASAKDGSHLNEVLVPVTVGD